MNGEDAEARLAAKNATVVRAALRQSFDAAEILAEYRKTQPQPSKNPTLDRAKARAWAMLNVRFDNDALAVALRKLWSEAYVTGDLMAQEALRDAAARQKAADDGYVDWAKWRPGDAAAAALLKPSGALERILQSENITLRGIDQTGYERLGTALSDAISLGLSDRRAQRLIQDTVASPARALSIAITEQRRAVSAATITRYQEAGLDRMEWGTSDPCPLCAQNSGVVVEIGEAFPSGSTQPPAHPYCRCRLLPVLDDSEPEPTAGQITQIEEPVTYGGYKVSPADDKVFRDNRDNYVYFAGKTRAAERAEILDTITELQTVMPTKTSVTTNRDPYKIFVKEPRAKAYCASAQDGTNSQILFNIPMNRVPRQREGWFMPSYATTSELRYTMAHEYGHAVEAQIARTNNGEISKRNFLDEMPEEARNAISEYGRTSHPEAFAEAWTEWFLSKGTTTNPAALWFAEQFGWKELF